MNKAQELELFRKLVHQFPSDSYIGEWLRQVDCEVESNLRSDFIPQISLKDAFRQCEEVMADAHRHAENIIKNAETQAAKIVAVAQREEAHVRKVVADAINVLERFR